MPYLKPNQNMKTQTLEQQLAEVKKQEEKLAKQKDAINKKIEAKANANKPKSIMERVKTLADVLKIAKPDKEELAIINYSGKSKRLGFARDMMILSLIAEVLNEGHVFKMDGSEYRWFPRFSVSSGFDFIGAHCGTATADAVSASRLCLKSEELAVHAGTIFLQYHKKAIM